MLLETPVLTSNHALKEWAVAVQALRAGEGIITVRKGGIREEAREFRMEHRRFLFFPTYEHQNPDQLQERYRPRLDAAIAEAPPAGIVQIDTWAEVTDVIELREEAPVAALGDYYVFSQEYAVERLQWRPKKPLHVLLLRVYRLPEPARLPVLATYGGCKSWIELAEPLALPTSHPALDERRYQDLRIRALSALRD